MLKILAGLVSVDSAEVQVAKGLTFGYLPQDGLEHHGQALFARAAAAQTHCLPFSRAAQGRTRCPRTARRGPGGTLVFVSHDRYFVDALATRVIEVNAGRTTSWLGNYEDFLRAKGLQGETDHSELRVEQLGASTPAQVTGDDREARLKAHATRKETQRSEQKRLKEVAEVEAKLAEREGEVVALEAQMADPELYHDAGRWKEISARHALLKDEVNNLFARWEGLQADE